MADKGRNLNKMSTMRISWLVVVIVALSIFIVHGKHGPDSTVCDLDTYAANARNNAGPKKPTLPSRYTVRIEANFIDKNVTQDIHEFYDGPDNKAAVYMYNGGNASQLIFLYKTNELITLSFDNSGNPPRCHVDDLAKSSDSFIFGFHQYANGSEHIFSANQVLRFAGGTPEVYINQTEARDGITVDQWQSCMYLDALDATVKLTWQFNANNTWTSAINQVVPVQLLVTGVAYKNNTGQPINREYVFTDFRPFVFYGPVAAFETPQGTYCMNRVSQTPLRNVTSMFAFSAEIFEPGTSYINWIKEYYDYDMNLVRYDYSPDPGQGSIYGYNRLIRVHDFNSGVAYIMDSKIGNCSISPISALGFDDESLDSGKVRMRTSKEFFYFDKVKYEYAGQRLARGITCDVWVAIRNDYPPGYDSPQTIWEWYFASADWMENIGQKYEFMLPVMLQITSQSTNPPMNIIYNIYDYNEANPNIWSTDVSSCFNYTHRKNFQMAFPGDFRQDIQNDVGDFKLALMQSLVSLGDISPLRISNTQVDYTTNDIVVSFTILDIPPIQGDAVQGGFDDLPLSDIVTALTDEINSNQFIVQLDQNKFPNIKGTLTAKPYSAKSSDVNVDTTVYTSHSTSNGYDSGAMGGLGFAMLVVGLLLGFGVLYIIYKVRGGSFAGGFAPKTFVDSNESKEME